ncbi:MAG: response regulator [Bacteroidales bacterium]|nr:response regulator [Bacteroidales bacterium]
MDSSSEYNWQNKSILIADDEKTSFIIIEELLKETGIRIFYAENGQQTIDIFKQNPQIDIILMDVRMPEMSGIEATKHIRSINRNIPIIAFTAYALSDNEVIALEFGCDDYLSKPIRAEYLLKKINEYITSKHSFS